MFDLEAEVMDPVMKKKTIIPAMAILVLLPAASCTTSEEITGEGDGETEDTVIDTVNEVGEPECSPETMCYADYPCRSDSICEGNTVLQCVTVGCEVTCGTSCCSGASCSGPGAMSICDPGEICMERPIWSGGKEATCLLPEEEGPADEYDAWHPPAEPSNCYY